MSVGRWLGRVCVLVLVCVWSVCGGKGSEWGQGGGGGGDYIHTELLFTTDLLLLH